MVADKQGRKSYQAIDCAKFIFSIAVIALHCGPLEAVSPVLNYYFTQCITRVAVPFFFICNGFFAFRDFNDKRAICKQCLKLIRMYSVWSVIYIPGIISSSIEENLSVREIIVNFLLGNSYSHLWYLSAAAVALFLVYISKKILKQWGRVLALACLFYVIGLSYDSYYGIFKFILERNIPAIEASVGRFFHVIGTTRNGIFFGYFFVAIGADIAENHKIFSKGLCKRGLMISFVFGIVEVALVRKMGWQRQVTADMYIFLVPMTTFIFGWLIRFENRLPIETEKMRQMSTVIYLVHIWIRSIWLRVFIPILEICPMEQISHFCKSAAVIFMVDAVASIAVARICVYMKQCPRGKMLLKWII